LAAIDPLDAGILFDHGSNALPKTERRIFRSLARHDSASKLGPISIGGINRTSLFCIAQSIERIQCPETSRFC
jgi:hypothetical protein